MSVTEKSDESSSSATEQAPEDSAPVEKDGPIEEYKALRAEILARLGIQQNILTLQLTISGAVVSFALASTFDGGSYFLLILPFTSYMLCGRYARHNAFIANIGIYIREELAHRIPGGIGWEAWRLREVRAWKVMRYADPLYVTFVGAPILGLLIASTSVFARSGGGVAHAGLVVLWAIGAVFALITLVVTNTFTARAREARSERMR